MEAARDHVAELFAAEVEVPEGIVTVVGVGGTYTSLAAIHLSLSAYDQDRVHGTVVPLDGLDRLVRSLSEMDLVATEAIPSLDPARAPVLLGGAVVAAAAVRHVGAEQVTVSEHDILDGLALSLAGDVG